MLSAAPHRVNTCRGAEHLLDCRNQPGEMPCSPWVVPPSRARSFPEEWSTHRRHCYGSCAKSDVPSVPLKASSASSGNLYTPLPSLHPFAPFDQRDSNEQIPGSDRFRLDFPLFPQGIDKPARARARWHDSGNAHFVHGQSPRDATHPLRCAESPHAANKQEASASSPGLHFG
jgi:hypothetical protein